MHRTRRVILAASVLGSAGGAIWWRLTWDSCAHTAGEAVDPCSICRYTLYPRLHEGMDRAEVLRLLGRPARRQGNPNAVALPPARVAELKRELERTRDALGANLEARNRLGPTYRSDAEAYWLQEKGFRLGERMDHLQTLLQQREREILSFAFPRWHGEIEVHTDTAGKVTWVACGYG